VGRTDGRQCSRLDSVLASQQLPLRRKMDGEDVETGFAYRRHRFAVLPPIVRTELDPPGGAINQPFAATEETTSEIQRDGGPAHLLDTEKGLGGALFTTRR